MLSHGFGMSRVSRVWYAGGENGRSDERLESVGRGFGVRNAGSVPQDLSRDFENERSKRADKKRTVPVRQVERFVGLG